MYTSFLYDCDSCSNYNILNHDNSIYEIQVVATGIPKESIQIETVKNRLTIKGEPKKQEKTYTYTGFKTKKLFQEFDLDESIKVKEATLEDGILSIMLEKYVPEEMKPKQIKIM